MLRAPNKNHQQHQQKTLVPLKPQENRRAANNTFYNQQNDLVNLRAALNDRKDEEKQKETESSNGGSSSPNKSPFQVIPQKTLLESPFQMEKSHDQENLVVGIPKSTIYVNPKKRRSKSQNSEPSNNESIFNPKNNGVPVKESTIFSGLIAFNNTMRQSFLNNKREYSLHPEKVSLKQAGINPLMNMAIAQNKWGPKAQEGLSEQKPEENPERVLPQINKFRSHSGKNQNTNKLQMAPLTMNNFHKRTPEEQPRLTPIPRKSPEKKTQSTPNASNIFDSDSPTNPIPQKPTRAAFGSVLSSLSF